MTEPDASASAQAEQTPTGYVPPAVAATGSAAGAPAATPAPTGELSPEVEAIANGYSFDEAAIELGVLMENDAPIPQAVVSIHAPLPVRAGADRALAAASAVRATTDGSGSFTIDLPAASPGLAADLPATGFLVLT